MIMKRMSGSNIGRGIIYLIMLVGSVCSCTKGTMHRTAPFPVNPEEIQTRIYEYVEDPERMPRVEIIYTLRDSVSWYFSTAQDSLYYVRKTPEKAETDTVWSLSLYSSDILSMRQLIMALNPHTIPYRYGECGDGNASLLIIVENDTILADYKFPYGVVPSEMVQIYKELYHVHMNPLAGKMDFPPYDYGSLR